MIEQGFLKKHFVGRDGFIWWIGQVVDETKWRDNGPGVRTPTTDGHKGFDFRYKVRIMGYHTADNTALTDDDLPWASVVLPVTAGTGNGGATQTPQIHQGDMVYGFFLDGEDAQQPIILGLIGYNQYVSINKDIPQVPFLPFSGYTASSSIPRFSLTTTRAEGKASQVKSPGQTEATTNRTFDSSIVGKRKDGASKENHRKGAEVNYLLTDSKCEPVPLGKIQTDIKKMIQRVQNYQKTLNNWEAKVSTKIGNIRKDVAEATNIDKLIQIEIEGATLSVSGAIKWLITKVQEFTINKINNTLKDTYYLLFPNQRPKLKKAVETANDLIACLFRKIISNLLKMVGKFLKDAVDRFINTPLCAIENFVGALIGKLSGLISNTLDKILKPIESIIGKAFDIADGVLGFIIQLLSFLSCEEDPTCAEIKEWSMWDGTGQGSSLDLNSLLNKVSEFASAITGAIDPENFDFDLDFSDVFQDSCNVGPILCGPPNVEFFGGGGSGAQGNAIISAAGSILGVDIISGGSYSSEPFVKFKDACGNGNGASGRVILNNDGSIGNVVITNPGTGYLPSPDGSQGGDGRTWAASGSTIVNRSNGTYDQPYNPGNVITLYPGDRVSYCGKPYVGIDTSITVTAPECNIIDPPIGNSPSLGGSFDGGSGGQYPVILEIGDIIIDDPGFGYTPGDSIVITPDNGAVVTAEFDDQGGVNRINIAKNGIGFKEVPDIYIKSNTGYNAKLIPLFNVVRIGNDVEVDQSRYFVKVVDCVGKF